MVRLSGFRFVFFEHPSGFGVLVSVFEICVFGVVVRDSGFRFRILSF